MVIMPTLSVTVIRGSYVAAAATMVSVRVRSSSPTPTVMTTLIGPPARFWSLVLSDAKHHGLLFKKDK